MKNLILYITGILLLTACYDDKGNYKYTDVNEVLVEMDDIFRVELKDTVLIIRPEITQTLTEGNSNLKYLWKHSTIGFSAAAAQGDTISETDSVAFTIKSTDTDYTHYFRLTIVDENTDIPYTFQTYVRIIKPFMGSWMVLHKQNGETRLGAVEFVDGVGTASNNAYYDITGKKFTANPLMLANFNYLYVNYGTGLTGKYYCNAFGVITDDMEEAGIYFQWEKFAKKDSLLRMVNVTDQGEFDINKITLFHGDQYGQVLITDGQLFQGNGGARLYKAKTEQLADNPTVHLTQGVKLGYTAFFYDSLGKRFLWYNMQGNLASSAGTGGSSFLPDSWYAADENRSSLAYISVSSKGDIRDDSISLRNIKNQDVLYMGGGYQKVKGGGRNRNNIDCYALAKGNGPENSDSTYVYVLNALGVSDGNTAAFTKRYVFTNPTGLNANSKFASSCDYNGILFYTVNNIVYSLDFTKTEVKATVMYQHPGGTITTMKFAKYEQINSSDLNELDYSGYGHEVYKSIGIVVDMGEGKSEFVILHLNNSGTGTSSVLKYDEFGDIADIAFV